LEHAKQHIVCLLLKKYVQRRRWITNQVTKEGVLMPEQVFNNHVISLLHHSKFSAADSVLQGRAMPQTENNKRLRIFVKVLAGDKQVRDDNFEMIAKTSPRNRVIMLLMRDGANDNKEALQLCQDSLNANDPVALYLTAVCHSRLEDTEKAEEVLYKAIRMRPDLENAARYDGDLSQLPMFKEDWETLFMTREEIEERERREMARFMKEIENIDLSLTFEGYKAKVKADKEAEEARIKA
jgi:tetratricopeptide (TPR) repeat protein